MLIRTRSVDYSTAILDISGSLSAESGSAICDQLVSVIAAGRSHIVLNLNGVSTIDAGGLGQVANAVRIVRTAKKMLHVVVRQPDVVELFSRTRLRRFLSIFDTEAE